MACLCGVTVQWETIAYPQHSSSMGLVGDMVKEQLPLKKGKEASVVGAWEGGSVSTDRTQEVSWACR